MSGLFGSACWDLFLVEEVDQFSVTQCQKHHFFVEMLGLYHGTCRGYIAMVYRWPTLKNGGSFHGKLIKKPDGILLYQQYLKPYYYTILYKYMIIYYTILIIINPYYYTLLSILLFY